MVAERTPRGVRKQNRPFGSWGVRTSPGAYRDRMGVIGELFPGKKLTHEGTEAGDGQTHTPRFDIDLDTGVVRVPRAADPAVDKRPDDGPHQA